MGGASNGPVPRPSRLVSCCILFHPRRLGMILSSACALSGRQTSSSRDASRSSLWRSASKAGQRSHRRSYDSSSLSHRRHVVSSDRLIRFIQRRSAGWWPLRKRRTSVISDLDNRVSCQLLLEMLNLPWMPTKLAPGHFRHKSGLKKTLLA